MRLKPVNARIIEGLYGDPSELWTGKAITLYATKVKAFGKVHDVVRVRERKPTAKQAEAAPPATMTQPIATENAEDPLSSRGQALDDWTEDDTTPATTVANGAESY
jgi:hypothetical protein